MEDKQTQHEQPNFAVMGIATVIGIVVLGLSVYAAYRYSQTRGSGLVFPGGVTYLGPSPTPTLSPNQPPTAPLRFTAGPDVSWLTYNGKLYPYSFSYPSTLTLVVFPGDMADSVAIAWGNLPPQQNILVNMEFIDQRDSSIVGKPKIEFVRSWYKYFSGLKGLGKIVPFTNINGVKGFKASYINYAGDSPNVDVFFDVAEDKNKMIHLANGILDPTIFDRIIDSVKWNPK